MAKQSPKKPASKTAKNPAKRAAAKKTGGFSAAEKAAMKERAREMKAEARGKQNAAEGEAEVLAKIAAMPKRDRDLAKRVHALVKANAPELVPRTWYGMPAYAKDGKVVCFFQDAHKFKSRYATLGFSDQAGLDKGAIWPTTFALTKLTAKEEKQIAALIKQAVR